ncbi:MAG TPA: CPBP family intramembrane glutamic endopeptidase [Candidatus Dormibacteraeota bacterium]|nr:CPBP family intramembrane glutamic endopeptidase [Candidatus Dormibacteraeota bacterium]
MISAVAARPAVRAAVIGTYVVAVEWARALFMHAPGAALPALLLGGLALGGAAVGWRPDHLGLGTSRFALRIVGGFALGAVLLLPAAVRSSAAPLLPAGLALAAVAVSVGEEIAFRGALYAALEDVGGAPVAIAGSTLLWTLAHMVSHPPAFLVAVAAAGLLLALWRWACKDLVAPIIGHVVADLAL